MINIGITGQNGFIGSHLYNTLGLFPEKYNRINFNKDFFNNEKLLDEFVKKCDVIVHLAAMNRHTNPKNIYHTNLEITEKLVTSLERTKSKAHILFSSSSQENQENLYGKSKKECREMLTNWAENSDGTFTGMIIPNVFGAFGQPNYNSFIATFCYKLTHAETPVIEQDSVVNLIYIDNLVQEFINQINLFESNEYFLVPAQISIKVSEVLAKLEYFKVLYFENHEIPILESTFDYQLFNTFRSYLDLSDYYPVKFKQNIDARGAFVEIIRLGIGGQCSFSTTHPKITRGNHFHTRKIERFAVIKGNAKIQLRKIDSDEVLDFYLDGNEPAFVDMPIWYTHNIKNIGSDDLYTLFWINEPYNPENPDTYFLDV